MKQKATYAALGWDFHGVWNIDEGNAYPTLLAIGEPSSVPVNLSASSDGHLGITVAWDAGSNGFFHRVYRATSEDGSMQPVSLWIRDTLFVDDTVIAGELYWYTVVSARNPKGMGQSDFAAARVQGMRLRKGFINCEISFEAPPEGVDMPSVVGAGWQINGIGSYQSGDTVDLIAPEDYQISFAPLSDWVTPDSVHGSLGTNETLKVSAQYGYPKGTVCLYGTNPGLNEIGARWRIAGGLWRQFGDCVADVKIGQVGIEFKSGNGYVAPGNINVQVGRNTTVTETVEYLESGTVTQSIMLLLLLD
jgi:hypothetical protein